MHNITSANSIGIIGGLGVLAGNDIHAKMIRSLIKQGSIAEHDILYAQRPFDGDGGMGAQPPNLGGRKLYIFDLMQHFEQRCARSVMLPCFVSHTFLHELQAELCVPIVSLMDALGAALEQTVPGPCKVGILTSDYVRREELFERHFDRQQYTLLYPDAEIQQRCVMGAVYGLHGLQAGGSHERAVTLLLQACSDLKAQGADVIIPGVTEIAIVTEALRASGVPVIDSNQAYVDYAMAYPQHARRQRSPGLKIGIIGGIGPAATVDFMNKIIQNTVAHCDQDHIKLVVEHNPKIPDRTANLIGDGDDPTLALYSACKRLEADDADLIAIPCNTAHAYVARIQTGLSIPIVNMLAETVAHIGQYFGERECVGLLATSGTVASRVYHDAARGAPFELIVPDGAHQALVMSAIYGEHGVKAGYLDGQCKQDLMSALVHLVERGATLVILGCTELPLLLKASTDLQVAGVRIALLDPTDILARRCVGLAQGEAIVTPVRYQGLHRNLGSSKREAVQRLFSVLVSSTSVKAASDIL